MSQPAKVLQHDDPPSDARGAWFSPIPRMLPLAFLSLLALRFPVRAQDIQLDLPRQTNEARTQRVSVEEVAQTINAGKPDWVELHFHVAPGFHINSHTPHDELLIPTTLALPGAPGYRVLQTVYPGGEPLRLSIGSGETLSAYSGDFHIRLQVLATGGESVFSGSLHYQACNTASCFPPRDLHFQIPVSAR